VGTECAPAFATHPTPSQCLACTTAAEKHRAVRAMDVSSDVDSDYTLPSDSEGTLPPEDAHNHSGCMDSEQEEAQEEARFGGQDDQGSDLHDGQDSDSDSALDDSSDDDDDADLGDDDQLGDGTE
jgi:hypothetical protein